MKLVKINRLRASAIGAVAMFAIAGAGAGVVAAATPTTGGETGIEATAPESGTGIEADGVGGHADADGQNVDHQFDGNE